MPIKLTINYRDTEQSVVFDKSILQSGAIYSLNLKCDAKIFKTQEFNGLGGV